MLFQTAKFVVAMMRILWNVFVLGLVIAVVCAILACYSQGQEINLKQTPNVLHLGNLHENLFRVDSLLRLGDGITTHRFLTDKCKCMHEANVFAPKDSNSAKIAAFQAGSGAILYASHSYLVKHHHTRLAIIVLAADIVSEGWSVGHNAYLQNDIDSHR